MSNFFSNQSYSSYSSCSSSSLCCLERSFKNSHKMDSTHVLHPAWSMSSLITALPKSPSTFASNTHHPHYSHYVTEFSSPRDQSFGIARNIDNDNNNLSTCLSDIDEWLEQANKFCTFSNHLTESVHSGGNRSQDEEDSRLSAICNTYLRAPEHELHNITLPCVREDHVFQGQTRLNNTYRTPKCGGGDYESTRLMEPYDEFLDDVWRRKQEAERDARKRAKHVELMLSKQERLWTRWIKFRHNELERKQFRASARTQRTLCIVREKAEKKKLKLRRSALKRFQHMQSFETRSPTENSWGSCLPLC
ncbi:hypothetical protein Fmac_028937 [Flemingia macrophylla]|uniref:Uncharacterized protein n=1 Tax=Flemingia macrophylla TaxID=520843 RepID=A0ABD1L9D9_9FABA